MNAIMNLKVGMRLTITFIMMAAISVLVGIVGINNMSKIDAMADAMYERELLGLSYIKEANIDLIYIGRARSNFLLATSAGEREKFKKLVAENLALLKDNLNKAKPLFVSDRAKEIFSSFAALAADYEGNMSRALTLGAAEEVPERSAALTQVLGHIGAAADKLDDMLTELSRQKESRAKHAADEAAAVYESSRMLMVSLIVAALCMGVLFGVVISRSITRPLKQAVIVAETVAAGDLTSRIEVTRKDETGQLLQALKNMNDSLVRIVGEVRTGTDTIATASGQIAAGNLDLSSRTEEQAGSLEETASSMEELTSTVKQNAENSMQASELAQSASDVALKGGAVVAQVVETMDAINASARKIVDIIGVIDGIAFQTNILALNAAVEAARAGEQGRGFAVVASEVRNLAQRSAAAAKEIKSLIGDSVEKVGAGAKLVDQAGSTMNEVVDSVKRVTDIMAEITAASREQASGIGQVNDAITQMDQVTQQNAALVEESAAAAASMQDQAAKLAQAVSVFKLDGERNAVVQITAQKIAKLPKRKLLNSAARGRSVRDTGQASAQAGDVPLAAAGAKWDEF